MELNKKVTAAEKKFFSEPANFAHVMYMAVFALVAILIAAAIIVTWRSRQAQKGPYNKHPTAQMYIPAPPSLAC